MIPVAEVRRMGRKKQGGPGGPNVRQVNVRVSDEFFERVNAVAETLGLEVSAFIRMVLIEHLREYEARAAVIRGDDGPPQP